jgi:hypothetical protein
MKLRLIYRGWSVTPAAEEPIKPDTGQFVLLLFAVIAVPSRAIGGVGISRHGKASR